MRTPCLAVVACIFSLSCGGAGEPIEPGLPGARPIAAPNTAPGPALKPPALRLPDTATPLHYSLELRIDPDLDAFRGIADIQMMLNESTNHLWLHGTKLKVASAHLVVDGKKVEAALIDESDEDFMGFSFARAVGPGKAALHVEYEGQISEKEYTGIFRQKQDETWYVYTQFEAIGARRAFPGFDEPRWKTPFDVTLRVDPSHGAAANAPSRSESEARGLKRVEFHTTKPLPTYLVAFAVGPFDVVDLGKGGRNKTPMRLLVPKGTASQTTYSAEVTGPILALLEDYFDMPYPYEKLDSVAVPHFLGAMENPGLITYASSLLLSKPENLSEGRRRSYASVAAHEIAHQWFGNLVTLAWWNDIWLNESFATWLALKITKQFKPEWELDVRAVERRNGSMSADSLISARKIRQPIATRDDIFNAFDAISYGKGAAVIAMFESWIGEDKFRDAMRGYMKKHAWKTATAEDFLAAIATVSEPTVAAAFSTFLDQAGLPLVSATLRCDKGAAPTLALAQERFLPEGSAGSAAESWHLPVCVKYGSGKTSTRQCTLLSKPEATVELNTKTCPEWVMANADAVGYYRVAYQGDLLSRLLKAGSRLSTPERIGVITDLGAMLSGGKAPAGDVLALVPRLLKDKNRHIVQNAARIAGSVHPLVPDERRPNYARFLNKSFGARARALGWTAKKGEDSGTAELREVLVGLVADEGQDAALRKQAISLTHKWLEDRTAVDTDMLPALLVTAARTGGTDLYDKLYEAAKAESDRKVRGALLSAMGAFPDKKLVERNLELLLSDEFSFREAASVLRAPMEDPALRQFVYDHVKTNYDAISEKLPKMFRSYLVFVAVPFCDDEHRADAEAFFKEKIEDMPGGKRSMAQALEQMKLCKAQKDKQQPGIAAFLKSY